MIQTMSDDALDAVQDHRIDVLERRMDKHDEMMLALSESQIRTDEQFRALAKVQESTQEMISGIGKDLIKWMMGIGSAVIAVLVGGQVVL